MRPDDAAGSSPTVDYRYTLFAPGSRLTGHCSSEGSRMGGEEPEGWSGGVDDAALRCTCGAADSSADLVLVHADAPSTGQVTLASGDYQLRGLSDVEGSANLLGIQTGYRVDGAVPLGAVEVMHPGRVWLSTELVAGERDQLSCLHGGDRLMRRTPSERLGKKQ